MCLASREENNCQEFKSTELVKEVTKRELFRNFSLLTGRSHKTEIKTKTEENYENNETVKVLIPI